MHNSVKVAAKTENVHLDRLQTALSRVLSQARKQHRKLHTQYFDHRFYS